MTVTDFGEAHFGSPSTRPRPGDSGGRQRDDDVLACRSHEVVLQPGARAGLSAHRRPDTLGQHDLPGLASRQQLGGADSCFSAEAAGHRRPLFPRPHRLCRGGRVADALTQDVLLAPIESSVIPLPHQIWALAGAMAMAWIRYLLADEVGLGRAERHESERSLRRQRTIAR